MTTLALFLLLWASQNPPAAPALGRVTLLEGSLRVIRGTTTFQGVEGMSLKKGDILESSDQAFVQLEFTNGAIIALGPSSRIYIVHDAAADETKGERTVSLDVVMTGGWFKSESAPGKRIYRFYTPLLASTTTGGNLVVRSNPNECDIFLESGSISVEEVNANGTPGPPIASKGQFFSRQRGAAVTTLERPSGTFLGDMPRQFRDTLPSRMTRYSGASIEPKAGHPVTFEEIEYWLTIPSHWRKGLPERFAPRLTAPEFRKQIEVHIKEFPEWEPVLHPPKDSRSPQGRK